MASPPPQIVCAGRPIDDAGQPIGEPCGRRYSRSSAANDQEHTEQARAAGWRISPTHADGTRDVMCNRCARPDPAIARGLTP